MAIKTKLRRKSEKTVKRSETKPQRVYNVERFNPAPNDGLSKEQVKLRFSQGLNNKDIGSKTKTEGQIIRGNILTFFNILNFILAIFVLLVGSYKNTLFMGLILSNIAIGAFQEIRSKRTIDKLSLISAPKAHIIRSGTEQSVPTSEIVLDDILVLNSGNQITSDAIVCEGEVEVNESLITGESDPVNKQIGDELLSGSFIVSGRCLAQVEHVGEDNYAIRITGDAKYVKKRNSQIMNSIDIIIKVIGFGLIPIGILLFWKQYYVLADNLQSSVTSTVAALIGMIPEGLVLLTSVVFAVSVIRLATRKTLVQDLYCVETLARVDVLCLDKTGTITEGTMQVDELMPFPNHSAEEMEEALSAIVCNLKDDNPTFMAIKEFTANRSPWSATDIVPFSSARKWSGVSFAGNGTFVMGAGEFILKDDFHEIEESVKEYSESGQRVILLAHSASGFNNKGLPADLECIGLVIISDKIRREAPRTLRYFADQGVALKVISGDNAVTVANIARKAGLEDADKYVDATTLKTDEDIEAAVREYSVFGRVTPEQKLKFVKALKAQGHTVAMTGDGVNDVLALKEADCSVAMASGSDAARTVSNLVLLDSNFASMPKVVAEGRRAINNLQRSASLFLSKTVFSAIIGVVFIFLNQAYPFMPIQLTLISTLTIGAPSFILALEPNLNRIKGSFIKNVMRLSIPTGVTMALNIIVLCFIGETFGISSEEMSTLAVLLTSITGFQMLFRVCAPFNALRGVLFGFCLAGFSVACIFLGDLFSLTAFTLPMFMIIAPLVIFSIVLMITATHLVDRIMEEKPKKDKRSTRKNKRKNAHFA